MVIGGVIADLSVQLFGDRGRIPDFDIVLPMHFLLMSNEISIKGVCQMFSPMFILQQIKQMKTMWVNNKFDIFRLFPVEKIL